MLSHYLLLVLSSFSAWEGCAFSLWPYRDNFMCSFYMKCTNIFLLSSWQHTLWLLIRIATLRWFWWVLVEQYGGILRNTHNICFLWSPKIIVRYSFRDPLWNLFIMKTHLFKYNENFTTKNWKFSDKNSDIFHISAQNIDYGYLLEPNEYPQTMFLSRNKKNDVYPVNPVLPYKSGV